MPATVGVLQVPASFETLRDAVVPDKVGQLLIECPDDLSVIKKAVAEVTAARQGKMLFLRGTPGIGKTTLAESAPVFLSDVVGAIITPPPEYQVSLSTLPAWLAQNLPKARETARDKIVLVNLDSREIPVVDETATQAGMGNLNALLRRTPSALLVWPVNNKEFAEKAIERLLSAGGQTALVSEPIYEVVGLAKDKYFDALQLLLGATSSRLEDAAITIQEAMDLVKDARSIGEYLRSVQNLIVQRYDIGEIGSRLPRVSIIITSNDDCYATCRLLRRGSRYLLDPDKILQFSRANIADDWRRYAKDNPRRSLSYISSLFEVRLLNLSSSAVVNACAFGENPILKALKKKFYPSPVRANAANAIRNSPLVRAMQNMEDVGTVISDPSPTIRKAYTAVQKETGTLHKEINQSIVQVLTSQIGMELPDLLMEYKPLAESGKDLRVDVWFSRGDRPETLEFTHRRDGDASVAVISSYVLGKIADYARDYGLL